MTKKTQTFDMPTLADIRSAIAEIDKQRESASLSREEREILELAAVALRDSERLVIEKLHRSIIKDMETYTSSLNLLAKEIRSKVSEMNKTPKKLDKIESAIKTVLKIVGAVIKYI
jgi:hypothetical protein